MKTAEEIRQQYGLTSEKMEDLCKQRANETMPSSRAKIERKLWEAYGYRSALLWVLDTNNEQEG